MTSYTPVVISKTRYARASDGISIAYQVIGDGPRDLVWVGSGLTFQDRGLHALKGVSDEWHLYSAAAG